MSTLTEMVQFRSFYNKINIILKVVQQAYYCIQHGLVASSASNSVGGVLNYFVLRSWMYEPRSKVPNGKHDLETLPPCPLARMSFVTSACESCSSLNSDRRVSV